MHVIEYYSDAEKSDLILGWRHLFRFKLNAKFKIENIILNPMFSDLLFYQMQNLEKCFTKEEADSLKKFRFGLDKEKMYTFDSSNLSYEELIELLTDYSKDGTWGSDLKYYLDSIKFVEERLSNYKTAELYYVNIEDEKYKKLVTYPGTFSYYISILAISYDNEELIAIDLGGD